MRVGRIAVRIKTFIHQGALKCNNGNNSHKRELTISNAKIKNTHTTFFTPISPFLQTIKQTST